MCGSTYVGYFLNQIFLLSFSREKITMDRKRRDNYIYNAGNTTTCALLVFSRFLIYRYNLFPIHAPMNITLCI